MVTREYSEKIRVFRRTTKCHGDVGDVEEVRQLCHENLASFDDFPAILLGRKSPKWCILLLVVNSGK